MAFKWIGALVAAAVFAVGSPAGADEARDAYREGVTHFEAGRYGEAAASFREAHRLKPSWKLLYNIGQSEAAAARYGLALEAFEQYMVEGADNVEPERREEVLGEIQRLRLLVGVLQVEAPDGVALFIDDVPRGQAPFSGPVRVAAGKHRVELRRDGEPVLEQDVSVAGGMTSTISFEEAVPEEPATVASEEPQDEQPAEEEPADEGGGGERLWTWVALGTGAAMLAGGAVVGGLGMKKENEFEAECRDKVCDPSMESEADTIRVMNLTADILFGVGVAAVVTGAVLFFVEPDEGGDSQVALAPAAGPDGAGLTISGRF